MVDGPAIELYVGGHCGRVQGEPQDLGGKRMFTAAHKPEKVVHAQPVEGALDSGAFTDVMENRRLDVESALVRQLAWERIASEKWGQAFQAARLVSYDRLIDEKWTGTARAKQRWTVKEAESAVAETIAAAKHLDSQRAVLAPRRLVLSLQGVDAFQYQECAVEVLKLAASDDWIGLGGWCILGMRKRWMPTFWQTMRLVLPIIAASGVRHIHIFGVLYLPVLGGLLHLADHYGLTVSTDSTAPVLACTWKDWKKAGARMRYWRDNVRWWQTTLATLRQSEHYTAPPTIPPARQETFL